MALGFIKALATSAAEHTQSWARWCPCNIPSLGSSSKRGIPSSKRSRKGPRPSSGNRARCGA